ncbi:MAG: nucleoside triphosphate pyrophosphohydrolase [Deltaproteobacteria bacterium]|nr:nucleoside triphosphate pyrophosphohydrolase [Deltaproteobacteria bacterium]
MHAGSAGLLLPSPIREAAMSYQPTEEELAPHREAEAALGRFLALMHRLRAPGGCPWDREQTLESLRPYLLEETYEVLEAIDTGDDHHHLEELGDLLLQIVFHAEIASEEGRWGMAEIVDGITEKLYLRHPHVFGGEQAGDASEAFERWEQVKAKEKEARGRKRESVIDGVPRAAPALMRAERIGDKASSVGFDWPDLSGVRAKLDEELAELDEALEAGEPAAVQAEVGDLLLTVANLARKAGVHPEDALREANARFETRFREVEERLRHAGVTAGELPLEELEAHWQEAKKVVG